MLRILSYLVSFSKLLWIGRWYPPGYVRDVSTDQFIELSEGVRTLEEKLDVVARQVEATRKKVYRDEIKSDGQGDEVPVPRPTPAPQDIYSKLAQFQSGDILPDDIRF